MPRKKSANEIDYPKLYTVKLVLRGHIWDKEKVIFLRVWPLKRGSIHMKFSMTGQENSDLLIQVTALAGFTVSIYMRGKKVYSSHNLQI